MTKKQRILLWVLMAVTGLFPLFFWYHAGRLIYVGDLNYPINPLLYWAAKLTQTWNDTFPGGQTGSQAPSLLLYQGIPALLAWLKVNLSIAQLLDYTIWVALPVVTMALLAEEIRNRLKLGVVFTYAAIVLYQFNVYRMIMFGDAAHMVIYATLPLVVGLHLRAERTRKTSWAVWAGVAMLLAAPAGPNPPMYAVFLIALLVFLGCIFAASRHRLETLKRYGLFALVTLGVSAFWIAPFVVGQLAVAKAGGLSGGSLANWVDSVSGSSSWYNLLRLQGAWDWFAGFNGTPYVPYAASYQSNWFLVGWTLALPAIALLALVVRPRLWRLTLPLAILGVAGFFLAMGTHAPMTTFFRWAVVHVPLFWIFRSPWYKFGFWQALATVLLASLAIETVGDWLSRRAKWLQSVLPVVGGLLVVGAGISVYPFITGQKFPMTTAYLSVPNEVAANALAIQQATNGGELVLLPDEPAFNYTWQWSGLLDPLFYATTNRLLYTAHQIGADASHYSRGWLYDALIDRLYVPDGVAATQSILAWLHPQAVVQRDDVAYKYYGEHDSPSFVADRLAAVGLTPSTTSGVVAPWHLYLTGLSDQRFQLSRNVVSTTNSPIELLGPLGDLGELTSDTAIVTAQATAEQVRQAGIPIRTVAVADISQPSGLTGAGATFALLADPGSYRLKVKQSAGATEPPLLSINGQSETWTPLANSWWQTAPLSLAAANTITTSSPPERQQPEHAATFTVANAWRAQDVTPLLAGTGSFTATVNPTDPTELDLSAAVHTLMDSARLLDVVPGRLYQVTFQYRTDPGATAHVSVHLFGVETTALDVALPPATDWITKTETFRVAGGTTSASLNFFAGWDRSPTVVHTAYRNVSVHEVSSIEAALVDGTESSPGSTTVVPAITSSQSPTSVSATVPAHSDAALLTFDQQFDSHWQLTGAPTSAHLTGNWYANSWILPANPSPTTVTASYSVQQWFVLGSIVTGIVLAVLVIGWFVNRRR